MKQQEFPVVATGTLSSGGGTSTNATVTIHASNTKVVVDATIPQSVRDIDSEGIFRFIGHVTTDDDDAGELVTIDKLHVTQSRRRNLLLEPLDEVVFGVAQHECVSLARLVAETLPEMSGIGIGQLSLSIESRRISDVETLLWETSKHLDRAQSTIILSGPLLPVGQYESAMDGVITLVGIMLSHSPYTTQTEHGYPNGALSQHVGFNGGLGFGHSKTVVSGNHADFLDCAWPVWALFDDDFKCALRVSSSYLAASCEGYLDSQLFSVFQAWEILAKAYSKHFSGLADKQDRSERKNELADLAKRLKYSYDEWVAELPGAVHSPIENFEGLVKSARRILTPDAVDYMIDHSGLVIDSTGLDIVALRQMTNKVRHTGMLPPREEYWSSFDTYKKAKFALELIILRTLGYKGLVKYEGATEWQVGPMDHFFRPN